MASLNPTRTIPQLDATGAPVLRRATFYIDPKDLARHPKESQAVESAMDTLYKRGVPFSSVFVEGTASRVVVEEVDNPFRKFERIDEFTAAYDL
jgi:hypothetical protein